MSILYSPPDGVAADFIPFYWKGQYHLFYLKDYRDPLGHGEGTPWWHLVTEDFVHFEDWGEALPRGLASADDEMNRQDVWVFTGSVIERDGAFHIFYTGHNPHLKEQGRPVEAVMHAVSPDLKTWTKDRSFCFLAPPGYEPDDWRDPFVFRCDGPIADGQAGAYGMLLAARKTTGPRRHRGCIALATSPDLRHWQVSEPFWAPDLYYTHECPDLFRMGDWWYLVYSTFSERHVTHYRMSRHLAGPWLAPINDAFDGRAWYAAKTAGDGQRRFAFGWLATREGERDDGRWQWGGHLVVHELAQQTDGTLTVHSPQTVLDAFTRPVSLTPHPVLGQWETGGPTMVARSVGQFSALPLGDMPETCLVEARLTCAPGTANLGLLLRASPDLEAYDQVRLEPGNGRLVFDRWPRPGDQPFVLERPLAISPQTPVHLRVLVDGTCVVIYADDQVALSCRMYDRPTGQVGLFVAEGEAQFEGIVVRAVGECVRA